MVTKCANPVCPTEFHYLRNGKLFLVEIDHQNAPLPFAPQMVAASKKPRRVEHYWLCDECIQTLTLAIDRQRGVITVPNSTPVAKRAAAS